MVRLRYSQPYVDGIEISFAALVLREATGPNKLAIAAAQATLAIGPVRLLKEEGWGEATQRVLALLRASPRKTSGQRQAVRGSADRHPRAFRARMTSADAQNARIERRAARSRSALTAFAPRLASAILCSADSVRRDRYVRGARWAAWGVKVQVGSRVELTLAGRSGDGAAQRIVL